MLKRAALLLSVLIQAFLAVSLSRAETKPLSITPFVGGYTFDGGQRLATKPVYGIRAGYDLSERWGVEGLFDYVATKSKDGGSADSYSYRVEGLYNLMPGSRLVPFLAAGLGGNTINDSGKIKDTMNASLDYGAGVKYLMSDSWALRGDLRNILVFNKTNEVWSNLEYTIGLSYLFGGAAAPAPAPPPPAPTGNLSVNPGSITKGQTATLRWTSENATDCDIQPGIGPVKTQGSVDVTPSADTGYTLSCSGPGGSARSAANVSVAAPAAPTAPKANLTATPDSIPQGQSGKLTWTSQDAENCDIQPGIGPVQPQGSMDITPSADTTYTLKCTGAGGTAESAASVSVVVPPAPKKEQLCQTLNIEFATGKADIPARYHDDIAKIADFMKEYPQVKGVIEGHTDNKGGKAYNDRLSERRAQSVKNYLVDKFGVDGARLGVKGYGYSKPVASNATAEGRQKNRRIVADFGCVEK